MAARKPPENHKETAAPRRGAVTNGLQMAIVTQPQPALRHRTIVTRNLLLTAALLLFSTLAALADSPRAVVAKAIVTEESEEQAKLIATLVGLSDPDIVQLLTSWK